MAHYDVKFSCGHDGTVELFGKQSYREWRLERYREFGICEECQRKARDEENAKMLAEAEEMGLPELNGSEKQITWAITIRQRFVEQVENHEFQSDECRAKYTDIFQEILDRRTSAHWWIDNRDRTWKGLVNDELEKIQKVTELKRTDNSTIAEQSKEEMTISAENIIYDGRVEVIVTNDLVKAIYEKNKDFISIVKSLKFQWNGNYWSRKITQFNGTAEDRASELIAKLVSKGFRVYCSNDDVREMTIKGTYKAESLYWIIDVNGTLGIKIYARNDEIYNYSRRLTNSKWNKDYHCVVVSISHYKEVLDFAKTFGFSITEEARKNIEAEIERENNNLKVVISNNKGIQNKSYKLLDTLLNTEYNVLEELIDD